MTEQEQADLLASYNTAQDQLITDRQALENQTAGDIAAACTAYDMTNLLGELDRILNLAVSDSVYRNMLGSTISVAHHLNNVTAPAPVEPDPEA